MVQLIRRAGTQFDSTSAYAQARAAVNVFGMTSVTGPPETWLIEAHDSFGSIEAVHEAVHSALPDTGDRVNFLSGDVLAQSRTLIGVYRPWFSYRPDQAARLLSRTRYFSVTVYRTRSGADSEFLELLKARKDFFDSVNLDRPEIAYHVISGAPSATYLLLAPLTSLKTLDESLGKSVRAEPGHKSGSPIELSRSHLLFQVRPRISYVSDEFASEFPEFWRPSGR